VQVILQTISEKIYEYSFICQRFKRGFSGFKALKGVNLEVGEREIVTIIGPNGAGKSTLLDAIVGKSPVASGHVYYRGKEITNKVAMKLLEWGLGASSRIQMSITS
jgi:ABC-type branched-subunit amino acid transport system ATPase component